MSFSISNNLNLWKWEDYAKWYRIDKKVSFFIRKIKWMFQRAKYGFCDRDVWNLDYTLGNYIASSVNKLADITHGYPYELTEEEWTSILNDIALNFYMGTNEDCWTNPIDRFLTYENNYNKATDEQKEFWQKWFDKEKEINELRKEHLEKGFQSLEKWFFNLWD